MPREAPSPPDLDCYRWRAAFHEAGHAVAAAVLRLAWSIVTIDQEGGGEFCPQGLPTEPRSLAVRSAAAYLAGAAAEFHFCGEGEPSDSDLAAAADLAARTSGEDPKVFLAIAERLARLAVRRSWPAVERVAAGLHERGYLVPTDLARLIPLS